MWLLLNYNHFGFGPKQLTNTKTERWWNILNNTSTCINNGFGHFEAAETSCKQIDMILCLS